jgi:hypothetical protein
MTPLPAKIFLTESPTKAHKSKQKNKNPYQQHKNHKSCIKNFLFNTKIQTQSKRITDNLSAQVLASLFLAQSSTPSKAKMLRAASTHFDIKLNSFWYLNYSLVSTSKLFCN